MAHIASTENLSKDNIILTLSERVKWEGIGAERMMLEMGFNVDQKKKIFSGILTYLQLLVVQQII